jgi:hypothetical protein
MCLRGTEVPLPGSSDQSLHVLRPIMKRGRVEIRAVGPDQGMDFRINPHPVENRQVP